MKVIERNLRGDITIVKIEDSREHEALAYFDTLLEQGKGIKQALALTQDRFSSLSSVVWEFLK